MTADAGAIAVTTADLASAAQTARSAAATVQAALETFASATATLLSGVDGSEAQQGAAAFRGQWSTSVQQTSDALVTIAIVLERSASDYLAVDAGAAGSLAP